MRADELSFDTASGARQPTTAAPVEVAEVRKQGKPGFFPVEPTSLREAGLNETHLESLVLKLLLGSGSMSGREIASRIALPFAIIDPCLEGLKKDILVDVKGTAYLSDFHYVLTRAGSERALRHLKENSYSDVAPVPLSDYVRSVDAQSIRKRKPKLDELRVALDDLVLSQQMLHRLGEAIHSGLGLFVFGAPGNGKTSIATRLTEAYGESIWIPQTINVFGEFVRLYDESIHQAVPYDGDNGRSCEYQLDERWVRIRRPCVVAGGELTMDELEVTTNRVTHTIESPLQMKSNCGTLLIDDFGRQRMRPADLLNRWIVPLESRHDMLSLPSGRKFKVPFDQLVVFATNIDPGALVDEAFLRRIPYKIEIHDPSESVFREIFAREASRAGLDCGEQMLDYLFEKHYRATDRCLRYCHPRDLVEQMRNYCSIRDLPLSANEQNIDSAVANYFAAINQNGGS